MASRRPLPRPATATLIGLLAVASGSLATLVLDYVVLGLFVPAALVIGVVLLAAAAAVGAGLRWAPTVGAIVAAAVLVGTFAFGVGLRRLVAPENGWLFASTVLMVAGGALATVAGVVATARQLERRRAPVGPRSPVGRGQGGDG